MPNKLNVSKETMAQRHVLSQQLYRLRRLHRFMVREGLSTNALRIRDRIRTMESRYESLGGYPRHKGNVL